MSGNPVITTRQIIESDLPLIMEWRMRPDITKYMNTDPVLTLEGQKEWLRKISADKTCKYWMIEIDGEPSGVINLADIDYENGTTSWAYYVANLKKRSFFVGIKLEWAIYDYVFFYLRLNTLHSEVFSLNKGVIQLHKTCGSHINFVHKSKVCKNNIFYDVTHMSISKDEWEKNENSKKNLHFFSK